MRRIEITRNRLVRTAVVAALIFVVTYTLAAAMSISGVGFLGGGEATVTSPADVDSVRWVLTRVGPRWMVTGVRISFDADLPAGTTIYVELLDGSDAGISAGSKTLTDILIAADSTVVDVSPGVRARDIVSIGVTIEGTV